MGEVVHARLDKELLVKVDMMIERGLFPNRSGLIREATRDIVSRTFSQATNDKLEAVARAAVAMIAEKETPGVRRVILYGSVARHEASEDSDIDLLVLVENENQKGGVLSAIIDVTAPIETATGTTITPIVMAKSRFEANLVDGFGFARAVAKEGVVLLEVVP